MILLKDILSNVKNLKYLHNINNQKNPDDARVLN